MSWSIPVLFGAFLALISLGQAQQINITGYGGGWSFTNMGVVYYQPGNVPYASQTNPGSLTGSASRSFSGATARYSIVFDPVVEDDSRPSVTVSINGISLPSKTYPLGPSQGNCPCIWYGPQYHLTISSSTLIRTGDNIVITTTRNYLGIGAFRSIQFTRVAPAPPPPTPQPTPQPTMPAATCPVPCVNGVCNTTSLTCRCFSGFAGATCSDFDCSAVGCVNGACVAANTCRCFNGFEGNDCSTPVVVETTQPTRTPTVQPTLQPTLQPTRNAVGQGCQTYCFNGGFCVDFNRCWCPEEFTGPNCLEEVVSTAVPSVSPSSTQSTAISSTIDVSESSTSTLQTDTGGVTPDEVEYYYYEDDETSDGANSNKDDKLPISIWWIVVMALGAFLCCIFVLGGFLFRRLRLAAQAKKRPDGNRAGGAMTTTQQRRSSGNQSATSRRSGRRSVNRFHSTSNPLNTSSSPNGPVKPALPNVGTGNDYFVLRDPKENQKGGYVGASSWMPSHPTAYATVCLPADQAASTPAPISSPTAYKTVTTTPISSLYSPVQLQRPHQTGSQYEYNDLSGTFPGPHASSNAQNHYATSVGTTTSAEYAAAHQWTNRTYASSALSQVPSYAKLPERGQQQAAHSHYRDLGEPFG